MVEERTKLLAEHPIGPLLFRLSLPSIIGMMANAAYNLVDAIFVGRGINEDALAGITIAFPIHILFLAFGMTIGIGSGSIVSRALGAGQMERAERAAGTAVTFLLSAGALIVILGSIFLDPLLQLCGATPDSLPYARDYTAVIVIGAPLFMLLVGGNNLVRAEGAANVSMTVMLISAGLNIVLDPIFIFWLDMGIAGAAWATVIAQTCGVGFLLFYLQSPRSMLKLHWRSMGIRWSMLGEMLAVGSGDAIRVGAGSAVIAMMNHTLVAFGGDWAVSVYGAINRLMAFLFMPLIGIAHGLRPILGFNYGARQFGRARKVIFLTLLVTSAVSVTACILLQSFPEWAMRMFIKDPELVQRGARALRLVTMAFFLVGWQVTGISVFQALGKVRPSFVLGLSRQVLFFIPSLLVLPRLLDLTGAWLAFPAADLLTSALVGVFFFRQMVIFHRAEKGEIQPVVSGEAR
ncbi:MAG: MATE family efflux transporter [Phycisphaerae bacterium]